VKDTKLALLLNEFNAVKDSSPNLAAMGFRTILTLIIQERAKQVNPHVPLATRDNLAVDPCIDTALKEHIFPKCTAANSSFVEPLAKLPYSKSK
jgi:hypothetical protein